MGAVMRQRKIRNRNKKKKGTRNRNAGKDVCKEVGKDDR